VGTVTRIRWALVATEVVVGVNAVYGGVGLIRDGMGMPTDWLAGTPFGNWLLPGLFLLLVVAIPMLAAAFGEFRGRPWAYRSSVLAAGLLLGWIVMQVALLQRFFFLQPVLFAAGLLVGGLAIWLHHEESLFAASTKDILSRR
jgi:hypothetical protein